MNKTVTIDGFDFSVDESLKFLSLAQEHMMRVGQVVTFKKYDITKDPPEVVGEYPYTVDADDLEMIRAGLGGRLESKDK